MPILSYARPPPPTNLHHPATTIPRRGISTKLLCKFRPFSRPRPTLTDPFPRHLGPHASTTYQGWPDTIEVAPRSAPACLLACLLGHAQLLGNVRVLYFKVNWDGVRIACTRRTNVRRGMYVYAQQVQTGTHRPRPSTAYTYTRPHPTPKPRTRLVDEALHLGLVDELVEGHGVHHALQRRQVHACVDAYGWMYPGGKAGGESSEYVSIVGLPSRSSGGPREGGMSQIYAHRPAGSPSSIDQRAGRPGGLGGGGCWTPGRIPAHAYAFQSSTMLLRVVMMCHAPGKSFWPARFWSCRTEASSFFWKSAWGLVGVSGWGREGA